MCISHVTRICHLRGDSPSNDRIISPNDSLLVTPWKVSDVKGGGNSQRRMRGGALETGR